MVRHTVKEHGNAQNEILRGQRPVTDDDFRMVPAIIYNPDFVVFGNKNKRGQDLIVYVKNLPDGSTLYFEEVRTGHKKLAGESLRKTAGASSETSLRRSLSPNARNVAGLPLKIIAKPNPNGNKLEQAMSYVKQQARGSITLPAYDGAPVRITLGKDADKSTFTHELAHLYLWHLKRLAAFDAVQNKASWKLNDPQKWCIVLLRLLFINSAR